MYNDRKILSDIFHQTMYGGLSWKVLKDTRINVIYTVRKYTTKEKYLTLYLFVYKKTYANAAEQFYLNKIKLFIDYTTRKDTQRIKTLVSEYNPLLIDLFDIVDVDF